MEQAARDMLKQGWHGDRQSYDDSQDQAGQNDMDTLIPQDGFLTSGRGNRDGSVQRAEAVTGRKGGGQSVAGKTKKVSQSLNKQQLNLYELMLHHQCNRLCKDDAFHANRRKVLEDSGRYPYHYESGIAGLHKMHREDHTYGDKRMDRIIKHYQKDKNLKNIDKENI